MAGSDADYPRLSPMTPPEARAELVRELKALVDAGEYFISPDEVARAVLAELAAFRRFE